MRDLLIVVDHKRDKDTEWWLFETRLIRVANGIDDVTAVREHCVDLGTTCRANGHTDRLRVRSWAIGWPEAFTADLDAIPPSAEHIHP